jgi:glycosyltransferase involved in cell wall biosynthesis
VRRGIYFKDGIQFARSIDFVLAMGIQGVDWFAKCGYPSDRLFPFAYVTERIEGFTSRASQSGPPSLIYVGQFIPRKGLDILLKALGNLRKLDWELTLVGSGPMEEKCRRMIFEHGLSERVRFLGPLKNLAARLEICRSDLLLLPSRYDGWGAVVNEALMAGVPAICSDHCGARDLLQASWRGEVFAAGSVPSLRKVLARWINAGRTDVVARRIWNWSSLIEGKSLAAYFLSILNFVYANDERPVPPWLRADQNFAIAELGAESRHAG